MKSSTSLSGDLWLFSCLSEIHLINVFFFHFDSSFVCYDIKIDRKYWMNLKHTFDWNNKTLNMNELKRKLVFDKPQDESMKKYASKLFI